ncbi:MAG: DNA primase [Phycisphaerales bacterium]
MSIQVGQSEIDQVRDATDLVALIGEHLPLRPKGREHVGLCPFHDDHGPSLTIVTHKGNAFYKCHACGAAGDAFNFVMDYHKMTFGEALRHLADRASISLRRSQQEPASAAKTASSGAELREANALAASFFRDTLKRSPDATVARDMIQKRGISAQMVEAFMLGAAPKEWNGLSRFARSKAGSIKALIGAGLLKPRSEGQGHYDTFRNRLIFPICDELGRPVAFGGRTLDPDDEPKYLNSAESAVFHKSRTLYGLHLAKRAIIESKQVIVTEGYTDVVACHQAGIRQVVATLGTALTQDHARILRRLCEVVVLVFDGDEAGQRAADRAVQLFFVEPVDVKICILPDGLDPADLLGQPDGPQHFRQALLAAKDALEYKVARFRDELGAASGLSGRQRCLERFLHDLANLGFHAMPGVRKRLIITHLADLLGVRIDDIERSLPQPQRRATAPNRPIEPQPSSDPAASELPDRWASTTVASRRRAEHDLLGVLIYQPSLGTQSIASDDGRHLEVTRLFQPPQFRDPAARCIAEVVLRWLEDGHDFTVQQLMANLQDPPLRRLVSDLYLEGERRLGAPGQSAVEHMQEICTTFQRLVRRERYQQDLEAYRQGKADVGRAEDALRDVIEQRRKQGYIPEAMPARVRSERLGAP